MFTETIVNNIAKQLSENYAGKEVYVHHIEQGFKEPCFYIRVIDATKTDLHNEHFNMQYNIDIIYFPETDTDDGYSVLAGFYELLRYLPIGENETILGQNMRTEKVDDVYHFFVRYQWLAKYVEDVEAMMEMQLESGVR